VLDQDGREGIAIGKPEKALPKRSISYAPGRQRMGLLVGDHLQRCSVTRRKR
jgi:hypothetical protein